jgi:hypothetical protein
MNTEVPRFSEYTNRICLELEGTQIPSDQTLVAMVRLQKICEPIELLRNSLGDVPTFTENLAVKIKTSVDQLEDYKTNILKRFSDDRTCFSMLFDLSWLILHRSSTDAFFSC